MDSQTTDPLILEVDRQIQLVDELITQHKSLLDRLAEMQAQLDHAGRIIKAQEAITSDKVNLDRSPDGDFYMSSFTDPSTMYEVSWFSCSCKDHIYRGKLCKHIITFRSLSDEKRLADLEEEALQARADLGL